MTEIERLDINLVPDEVLSKFLRQFRVAAQSLRHAHAAVRLLPAQSLPMLDVDGLAFVVDDPARPTTANEQLRETEGWLLRAAFIDLITGLNESLMEGCRIVRIHSAAKASGQHAFESKERVNEHMDSMDDDLMRMAIPELMSELQRAIGGALPLYHEMTSINKVRNCLIHRNGVVGRRDLNVPEGQLMRISYVQHQVYVRVDGVEQRVDRTLKAKTPTVSAMKTEHVSAAIDYPLGSTVCLTTDLVNDVAFTCFLFLHNLRLKVYEVLGEQPKQVATVINLV